MQKTREWIGKCKNCGADCEYEIKRINCNVRIDCVECRICGGLL